MPGLADVFGPLPPGSGPIGLLSSDEFTPGTRAFDEALLSRARGRRVAVLPCADHEHAALTLANARAHLEPLGATVAEATTSHRPLDGPITEADVYYLPGGSPADLLACARGSTGWDAIARAWRDGATLAGSSAGAMALCEHCLVPAPGADKPTRWTGGLGPIQGLGLAVHATTRPAAWLREVAEISRFPVVAIPDGTGVLLDAGSEPQVVGRGHVTITEPSRETPTGP